jgi:hypothetical protein
MMRFVQRHAENVLGVLSGFDRMLFRGTQRMLASACGLMNYLWSIQVLLKDFGDWSEELTRQLRAGSEQVMIDAGRPCQYLNNPTASKEELALRIAARDGIENGPICLISAVEPCWSYEVVRNRVKQKLVLEPRYRKCLHLYHYRQHPQLGLLHVRVQTWLPFGVRVCLNGREWLCRQLDQAGIRYERRDNCLVKVSDLQRTQALLDEQLATNWPALLNGLERAANPSRPSLLKMAGRPLEYYWSVDQSEWATDVMFKSPAALSAVYPRLLRQGMLTLGSADVLRFLGKKLEGRFTGEVCTDLKRRIEGTRLKHRVNGNSVKMYDKQGSVLRVETTINDASEFKVFRGTEAEPAKRQWRKMRKGIADLHRRAQVSGASNERYLSHLAAIECPETLRQILAPLAKTVTINGRRHRGLRLLAQDDGELLEAVSQGEFAINGFRNGDIRTRLFGADGDEQQTRRRCGQVSRKLALLRAHGLIRRVPRTRRWMLTNKGGLAATLLAAAKNASAQELMAKAA